MLPHRFAIDRIEALIHRDAGRNVDALMAASQGGLWQAASALAAVRAPRTGLITGFFVPRGEVPAAETDGPAGAALIARGMYRLGLVCRVLTDEPCRTACEAALTAAGAGVPVDSVPLGVGSAAAIAAWRAASIDWAIAIERCGRAADGGMRNMRGQDIGAYAEPLDDVFSAGPWRTIAIGDGGNEIGMGSLPPGLIAAHIAHGEQIACVTPADHLVMAGVSHWGAYALLAALAVLRPDWRDVLLDTLDPDLDAAIVAALVANGPAVDGVSLRRAVTIDNIGMDVHRGVLEGIRAVVVDG